MINYAIYSLIALVVLFILYRYLKLSYSNYSAKRKTQKSLKRGYVKEKEAAGFLKKRGYLIIQHAQNYSYNIKVNGKEKKVTIEIDYLVRKNGKTYIVEVKSGHLAPNISNSSTRRQVLEYYMFIPNDGILLLDMENEKVLLISQFLDAVDGHCNWRLIDFDYLKWKADNNC